MEALISTQLVKYLEARGVTHVFGLCGHTNIAVLAELAKSRKIKFVNTRHEQIAAHAADGYARATRKASVPSLRAMAWYPAWVRALPRARWTVGSASTTRILTAIDSPGCNGRTRAFGTVADSRPQKTGTLAGRADYRRPPGLVA